MNVSEPTSYVKLKPFGSVKGAYGCEPYELKFRQGIVVSRSGD
jgi:hypothetical protein